MVLHQGCLFFHFSKYFTFTLLLRHTILHLTGCGILTGIGNGTGTGNGYYFALWLGIEMTFWLWFSIHLCFKNLTLNCPKLDVFGNHWASLGVYGRLWMHLGVIWSSWVSSVFLKYIGTVLLTFQLDFNGFLYSTQKLQSCFFRQKRKWRVSWC